MQPPTRIKGYTVIEYGQFANSVLPAGYVPPPDGRPPLRAVQNLALCTADGVDGYYLLYCTPDWEVVTYEFNETMAAAKRGPRTEFGLDVVEWHTLTDARGAVDQE